ncbi:MAG: DUF58 domain-containing protein, partial [Nocardioides sp.]
MREALRGLTTRGRAFLAAGLTATVTGLLLDQVPLLRAGLLATVLTLAWVVLVGRSRYRLTLHRSVTPTSVTAGQAAKVELAMTNEGASPRGIMFIEEHVPYALGSRPRFTLEGVTRGWHGTLNYTVRSDARGRFEIGPVSVRASDPFNFVEYHRAFRGTTTLTVTPRVVPLGPIQLTGAWTGSGDNRPRAFATGSAEDVTVREYRQGDDLRRVHWRSSARVGELMVRREEQPWQSRATVFLDNREDSHRGTGLASTFETAVIVAASAAVHLTRRGFLVRLVTATGEETGPQWHMRDEEANRRALLESLAVVDLIRRKGVESDWLVERGHSGIIVGAFGRIHAEDRGVLRRMATHSGAALAIAL